MEYDNVSRTLDTKANLSELMELGGKTEFFPGFPNLPFMPISEAVDKDIAILDVVPFENDKGPGCAVRALLDGEMCKLVTHSVAICKVLASDEFVCILGTHPDGVNAKVVKRCSLKSGRNYYALG